MSLALGGECSPQAALPFAVTLIKSASPRSDVGSGSFFPRPAARLMTRLGLPLCASVAAIRHCQQVGSLCPPKLWGNKLWGRVEAALEERGEERAASQWKELRRKRNLRNNTQEKGTGGKSRGLVGKMTQPLLSPGSQVGGCSAFSWVYP